MHVCVCVGRGDVGGDVCVYIYCTLVVYTRLNLTYIYINM